MENGIWELGVLSPCSVNSQNLPVFLEFIEKNGAIIIIIIKITIIITKIKS